MDHYSFGCEGVVNTLDYEKHLYSIIYLSAEIAALLPLAVHPRLRVEGEINDYLFSGAFRWSPSAHSHIINPDFAAPPVGGSLRECGLAVQTASDRLFWTVCTLPHPETVSARSRMPNDRFGLNLPSTPSPDLRKCSMLPWTGDRRRTPLAPTLSRFRHRSQSAPLLPRGEPPSEATEPTRASIAGKKPAQFPFPDRSPPSIQRR
jgi:hypothetical protein